MMYVCMLVAVVGISYANLVVNGNFDGNVAGWKFAANGSGYEATHDVAYFGWQNLRSMYQNDAPVAIFEADTVYTMTVLITSPTGNNTDQYRGAQLVIWASGSGLRDVSTLDYWFPAEDRLTQTGTVGTYREVTMTLDTAVDTGVVGYQIAVGIRGLVDNR